MITTIIRLSQPPDLPNNKIKVSVRRRLYIPHLFNMENVTLALRLLSSVDLIISHGWEEMLNFGERGVLFFRIGLLCK